MKTTRRGFMRTAGAGALGAGLAPQALQAKALARGRAHDVVTGVALARDGVLVSGRETTEVVFAPMTDEEVDAYVASGEPADKAGAYALQGLGGLFVERISGTPSNVIGLPLRLVRSLGSGLDFPL